MESRPSRGRGGQWRRGGGAAGGNDGGGAGDRRGRGRGGHHRGRGKREHYRGRGREFPEDGAGDFFRRASDEQGDDKENAEDEMPSIHSRRKLESNWDRYEEAEKEEAAGDDVPVQRGTDYHVLLTSAGDSFTQFRFSEEKDWEVDSLGTNQVPALFVDLETLARSLQELPLHRRLDLEPSIVQESTPVELPSLNKADPALGGFKPPGPAHSGYGAGSRGPLPCCPRPVSEASSAAASSPVDDAEEDLDHLLGLREPVQSLSLTESKTSEPVLDLSANSENAGSLVEEIKGQAVEVDRTETEQEPENLQQKSKPEITEEDLEDWLDSMIS